MALQNKINMRVGSVFIPRLFVLTPPEIIGAFATPVILLPPPGADLILSPINIAVWLKYNSVPYTAGGSPRIILTNGLSALTFNTTTILNAFSTYQGIQPVGVGAPSANLAFQFTNTAAPYASGNSNLYIRIIYRVWGML